MALNLDRDQRDEHRGGLPRVFLTKSTKVGAVPNVDSCGHGFAGRLIEALIHPRW